MKAKKENKSSNLKQKLIKSFYITAIIFGSFGLSQKAFAVDLGEAYPKTRESDKNLTWENYKKGPIKLDYTDRYIGMAWKTVPKYEQVTIEHLQRVAGRLNDLTYLSKSNFDKMKTIEDKKADKDFEHLNQLGGTKKSDEEIKNLEKALETAKQSNDKEKIKTAEEALRAAKVHNINVEAADKAKKNLVKALSDKVVTDIKGDTNNLIGVKKVTSEEGTDYTLDTTNLKAALDNKVGKTELKNELDKKANAADVYTKEETSALVNSGTSAAVALAGLHALPYDPERPSQLSAAFGLYKGSKSIAVGLNHYINENTLVTGAVSTAFGSGKLGGLAVNVGITYRFGKGKDGYKTIKERRENIENMRKEIQDLRELINALQSEIKNLKK